MKKLRIVLLPAALILIGAGAAFATNVAKNSGDNLVSGYLYNSSTGMCEQKRTNCSPSGSIYCTWSDESGSHILSKQLNETTCGKELFEP
jgi:hypothetical protein